MSAPSRTAICAAALLAATFASGGEGSGGALFGLRLPHLGVAAAAQSAVTAQPSIARAFLDEARLRADEGDWAGAASLLKEAEESDGTDSDVRYLSALAALRNGAAPAVSIAELDAAVAANRFAYYNLRDALSLKAELLVRSGRYTEALDALRGIPLDADARWIRCRAFLGLNDRGSFDAEIGAALAAFPDDPRFPRVFLERYGGAAGTAAASHLEISLGDTILSRVARYALLDPEMPVLAAPIMADQTARRDSVLAYRASGGKSARATLLALEYGIIDEKAACAELFSGAYPLTLDDVLRALDLARNDAERSAVGAALDGYNGALSIRDAGGVQETAQLQSGRARQWSRSSDDERGHIAYAATLADEAPQSFELSQPGSAMRVTFAAYPYCAAISFTEASTSTEYSFAPEALSYAPIVMRAILGQGEARRFIPVASADPPPTEAACAASALAITLTSSDGKERQVTSMDRGIPQRRETWKDGRLYAVLAFDKGHPTVERVDTDGDGRYETERIYGGSDAASPSVVAVRIDTKGTGIFDYREQLVPPYKKEWDFDDDGSIDAIQSLEPDGSVLRQFSTKMNGSFDETMTIRDDKILSLTRNGRKPALIADRNPLVTWIGEKPFNLGSNVPSGEGVFTVMNKRIRIVRVGTQVFAEIVP